MDITIGMQIWPWPIAFTILRIIDWRKLLCTANTSRSFQQPMKLRFGKTHPGAAATVSKGGEVTAVVTMAGIPQEHNSGGQP